MTIQLTSRDIAIHILKLTCFEDWDRVKWSFRGIELEVICEETLNRKLCLVEEYVQEAEHQDGEDYWDSFGTKAELVKDFRLYITNYEE